MNFESRISTLRELGVPEKKVSLVQQYLELLWASNDEMNLISRKMSQDELIDNHCIDCLLPLVHFPKNVKRVADFGSGGGLPGVLYGILFPEIEFQLYEKSQLKQSFLSRCLKLAPNLKIDGEIPKRLPQVELVIARGFKPIDVILDMSRDHYENGGEYFLLKGRQEKINEELDLSRKKFKTLHHRVLPLTSPVLEVERHLVLLRKAQDDK